MKTIVFHIDQGKSIYDQVQDAASIIKSGGIVAFPTETVYGLGGNTFNEKAIKSIFQAKQRPADDPLIVHVSSRDMFSDLVSRVPESAVKLMDAFWPGPLTIVLEKSGKVPGTVTAGLPTVAVRMPDLDIALEFIRAAGVPIAAPSANLFERPSPTRAEHVLLDLDGRIDGLIDGGKTTIGVESTIVDLSRDKQVILRPGGIPRDFIEHVIGKVGLHESILKKQTSGKITSPGMHSKHYAPDARLVLVKGHGRALADRVNQLIDAKLKSVERIGVLVTHEPIERDDSVVVINLGTSAESIAKNLFDAFRKMNEKRVDTIIAEGTPESGLGLAIMNRLVKAATEIITV
ncbi:MAG: L-threonylcarbamoyladenylate synthase [Promethearchaeota archaeon]